MRSLAILTILAVLLLAGPCKTYMDKDEYLNSFSYKEVTEEQLVQFLYDTDTSKYVLIDLRNPHDYAIDHLPGSINIPSKNLIDKKYRKLLKSDKIKLAYGYNPSHARLIAAYANHMGYKNFFAVLGGFECVKTHFLDKYAIYSGQYDDEKPFFNYKEKYAELTAKGGAAPIEEKPKPVNITVPVKKKQVGGGCE